MSVDLESLLEIEIGRQAGSDLATKATQACEALQLGVIGHASPMISGTTPTSSPRVLHWQPTGDRTAMGSMDCRGFILMAVNAAPEILDGCCCAATATAARARVPT